MFHVKHSRSFFIGLFSYHFFSQLHRSHAVSGIGIGTGSVGVFLGQSGTAHHGAGNLRPSLGSLPHPGHSSGIDFLYAVFKAVVAKLQPAGAKGIGLQDRGPGLDVGFMIVVLSLAIGAVLGELGQLEERLDRFGQWLTGRVGERFGDIGKGFINASLVYCIGAMLFYSRKIVLFLPEWTPA